MDFTIDALIEECKQLPQPDLGIIHHFSGGVYAKQMHIPKDHLIVSHKHEHDHMSILAVGSVLVQTDDSDQEYTAPACIEIKKNVHHAIIALEDTVWYCIHATDETDADKVDEVFIKKEGI